MRKYPWNIGVVEETPPNGDHQGRHAQPDHGFGVRGETPAADLREGPGQQDKCDGADEWEKIPFGDQCECARPESQQGGKRPEWADAETPKDNDADQHGGYPAGVGRCEHELEEAVYGSAVQPFQDMQAREGADRKSTRLN